MGSRLRPDSVASTYSGAGECDVRGTISTPFGGMRVRNRAGPASRGLHGFRSTVQ